MTTATDWDDATWTDTGEHAVVTDVISAPTETPFLPSTDPYAGMRCTCGRYHESALVAPTAEDLARTDTDGMPLTPIAAAYEWPTWLGEVHHADAEWAEIVTRLRAMPDQYSDRSTVWDDDLRALLQPIETDWWERESRLMVGLVTREQHSVYAELAPERIHTESTSQPDRSDVERMKRLSDERHARQQRSDVTIADYADSMDALDAHEAAQSEPRRSWWRRLLERWG